MPGLSSAVSLRNDIFTFGAKVVLEANGAAKAAAEECGNYARQIVPVAGVDTAHGSRPGALRDSIIVEGDAAGVGNHEAFYAGFVNKGTVNMPANPFWKKSVNRSKRMFYVACGRANRGRK